MHRYLLVCFVFALLAVNASADVSFAVRVIHFVPADTIPPANLNVKIRQLLVESQSLYRDEMVRHGYGSKTYRYEKDINDNIVINRINGVYNSDYYQGWEQVQPEVQQFMNNAQNNIYLVLLSGMRLLQGMYCGVGWDSTNGNTLHTGVAFVPASNECLKINAYIAHELGHAFGLRHNLNGNTFLMGVGNDQLSYYEAAWLDAHHYFNDVHSFNPAPQLKKVYAPEQITADTYKFKVDVADTNQLSYAHIFLPTNGELVSWAALRGIQTTIEFTLPFSKIENTDKLVLQVMDVDGNYYLYNIPVMLNVDPNVVYLSLINGSQPIPNAYGLTPKNSQTEWTFYGRVEDNKTGNGNNLEIGGQAFTRGISVVPADSIEAKLVYDLTGANYTEFVTDIGLSDEHDNLIGGGVTSCTDGGNVIFIFKIDGDEVYNSGEITGKDDPEHVSILIPTRARELTILVNSLSKNWCDAAVLGNARLLIEASIPTTSTTAEETDDDTPTPPVETEHDPNDADVNDDGVVNVIDLVIVAINFGAESFNPKADLNGDGKVDGDDIRIVLAALEGRAAPSPPQITLQTGLLPNYPNPFNPETWIPYQLASESDVQITIYAANGQIVRTLNMGIRTAGRYIRRDRAAYWDGLNMYGERVVSGVYFYQLKTENALLTRKMLVLK